MKRLLLVALLALGCGADGEPIEVEQGILVTVKPAEKPGLWVSCELDGEACKCQASECSAKSIEAAVDQCNRLRNPAVVE